MSKAVKNLPQYVRPGFDSWVRKIPLRKEWQPTPVFLPGKSHGPSLVETVGSFRASEKSAAAGVQREKYREFRTGIGTNQHPPT